MWRLKGRKRISRLQLKRFCKGQLSIVVNIGAVGGAPAGTEYSYGFFAQRLSP